MSDTFRKVFPVLPEDMQGYIYDMKSKAEELKDFFDTVNNREMSIAQTNLEQAIMWATKACVKKGEAGNAFD